MRTVTGPKITDAVADLCLKANFELPADVLAAFARARERECSPLAADVMDKLIENAQIARSDGLPMCQDCGVAVVFADLGRDVHLTDDLELSIHEGVRRGYELGFLRKSVVRDPLQRDTNTGDNTPAVVHVRLVQGDRLKLTLAPKGGGSENMSALWMMVPAEGRAGVVDRIVGRIAQAGGKPCPPLILGVGLGGTMEKAALLSKYALLREVGRPSDIPEVAALESDILRAVNNTGVGPLGLGGAEARPRAVRVYQCSLVGGELILSGGQHTHLGSLFRDRRRF